MGALTPYGRDAALDALLGDDHGPGWPDTVYVGISSTDPTVTVTEPVGGGYTRVAMPNASTHWTWAEDQVKSNAATIAFPVATGDWGVFPYVFLSGYEFGTSVLAYDQLAVPPTIVGGDLLQIPIGGLVVSC